MSATTTSALARTEATIEALRDRLPYKHELARQRLAVAVVGALALEWAVAWVGIGERWHFADVLHRHSSLIELGLFLASIALFAFGVATRTPLQQMFDGQEDQTILDLRHVALRLAPLPLVGMVLMLPFCIGPSIWLVLLDGGVLGLVVLYVCAYLVAANAARSEKSGVLDDEESAPFGSVEDLPLFGKSLPQAIRHDADETLTLEQAVAELDALTGLHGVKEQVHELVADLEMQKRRAALGLATPDTTVHLAFVGNPGTGKTTVARLLGKIFRALGILESGHVVEVDRSKLVGPYVSAASILTNARVDEALGGELFIDEAYTLVPEHAQNGMSSDNGQEAVDTLLKRMEDDRGRLVVIAAGYERPMERFLESNPGLRDRFTRIIKFDDYTVDELLEIIHLLAGEQSYEIVDAGDVLRDIFAQQKALPNFSNARFARNLLQEARFAHAARWRDQPRAASERDLVELTAADFEAAAAKLAG